MPFQAVPNVVLVKMVYSADGGPPIVNDLYVRDLGGWTVAKLDALTADFHAWWTGSCRTTQVATLVLSSITAKDLSQQFGARFELIVGEPGTRAGSAAPASIAAIVNLIGDPGAPPAAGRVMHPGCAEADVDSNLLTVGYAAAVEAAYEALRAGPGFGASQALGIVSRHSGSSLQPAPHGQTILKPTARGAGVFNTLSNVSVPERYGIVKSRRPAPL